MKKLFLFLFAMISVSNLAFAQNEVRGVETKVAKYEGRSYETKYKTYRNLWFGYSFTNMNSIPVSVDAELYKIAQGEHRIVTTKSFTLKSGETYIWKFETNDDFQVYYPCGYYNASYHSECDKDEPSCSSGHNTSYYIKYKAYKLL